MPHRMTIDRYEGRKKEIAVLVTEDGEPINCPKKYLPKGCKTGDVLMMTMERDAEATKDVADRTKSVQDDLRRGDKGGGIQL